VLIFVYFTPAYFIVCAERKEKMDLALDVHHPFSSSFCTGIKVSEKVEEVFSAASVLLVLLK
jgi:hypothetical protein